MSTSSSCGCTGQCSCGSSVIPTGPQGPMGQQGPSGPSGIMNIYSSPVPVQSGSTLSAYVPIANYTVPGNTLKNFIAGKADALDLTIGIRKNFKDKNFPPSLYFLRLSVFGNVIYTLKVVNIGELLFKARISMASTTSANVNLLISGFPIQISGMNQGTPAVNNTTITGLNFAANNPITLEIYQTQANGFTLKSFYVDKINS